MSVKACKLSCMAWPVLVPCAGGLKGQSCCFHSWQIMAAMQDIVSPPCTATRQLCPQLAPYPLGDLSASDLVAGQGAGLVAGEGPGVLEIKCPFNRGNPQNAAPPKLPQWYYMPQVSACLPVKDIVRAAVCHLTVRHLPSPSSCEHDCIFACTPLSWSAQNQGMASHHHQNALTPQVNAR